MFAAEAGFFDELTVGATVNAFDRVDGGFARFPPDQFFRNGRTGEVFGDGPGAVGAFGMVRSGVVVFEGGGIKNDAAGHLRGSNGGENQRPRVMSSAEHLVTA